MKGKHIQIEFSIRLHIPAEGEQAVTPMRYIHILANNRRDFRIKNPTDDIVFVLKNVATIKMQALYEKGLSEKCIRIA
ncbi:MAG: hypothetical protein RSG50_08990 [Clostridia bacterium]